MTCWRLAGGRWVPWDAIPLEDRGFRYGMSVFETVAICRGRAVFPGEHLDRLARAADVIGWSGTDGFPGTLPSVPYATASGVLRIYLTAGPGSFSAPPQGAAYALFEECEVGTGFSPARVLSSPAVHVPGPGGWKTGNYWQNVRALVAASEAEADEALLFNPAGCLVSACMANVFLEIGDTWKTPALECGARDGVVREWVKSRLPVEETLLSPEDTAICSACFLTNSRIGLRPVLTLDGRPLRNTLADLQQTYRRNVLEP